MSWNQLTFLSGMLQVLAFAALCKTESAVEDKVPTTTLLPMEDHLVIANWTIFGIVAITTLIVLILLIPTLLYYNYWATPKKTIPDADKK